MLLNYFNWYPPTFFFYLIILQTGNTFISGLIHSSYCSHSSHLDFIAEFHWSKFHNDTEYSASYTSSFTFAKFLYFSILFLPLSAQTMFNFFHPLKIFSTTESSFLANILVLYLYRFFKSHQT